MDVVIHAAHAVDVSSSLRQYAEAKVRRLDRHFDRIIDARLDLDVAGKHSVDPPKVAELHVHVNGGVVQGKVTAHGLREAVDLVTDKVDEQLRRRKERIKGHKR
ncbi:MAG: putative sigma-54 modulation protein [Chloroflexota bacterium]|jgi:putative sigma-54 modulation protein|nr:putative sigma-54 modulation protein [Chloroflexota bacterium]